MKYFILFVISIGFTVNAFAADTQSTEKENQINLKINQTVTIEELRITYLETIEDSRCPLDVTCIWQGRASINLNVEFGDQSENLILTLMEDSTGEKDTKKISLIDLQPYPVSTQTISSEDYVATISITKNNDTFVPPPLKQYNIGVSFNDVKCKPNLVLIQKIDTKPACVTHETKQILIERGWSASKSL